MEAIPDEWISVKNTGCRIKSGMRAVNTGCRIRSGMTRDVESSFQALYQACLGPGIKSGAALIRDRHDGVVLLLNYLVAIHADTSIR
jgi:hypothetical protein